MKLRFCFEYIVGIFFIRDARKEEDEILSFLFICD